MSLLEQARSARRAGQRTAFAAVVLALALSAMPVFAEYPVTTLATLLDRAQIQDMIAAYYADFKVENGKMPDLGSYYIEDGTLEVKGENVVARGRKQIDGYYETHAREIRSGTRLDALFASPVIVVHGDSATANFLWTFMMAATAKATPQIVSAGRERDELVKQNCRWYFKRRVITE